jgi:hypothetical protein
MKFFALFLLTIVITLQTSAAATIYLDPSSSGDETINEAMDQAQPGDTIYLKDGTFWVDNTINFADGVTLTGDGEVKLVDYVGWDSGQTMFYAYGISDIRISGITIDGNSQGNTDVPFGQGYYGLFLFRNCENVVFDGVTLEYAKSDGIIFRNGDGITVTNCSINKMGHEGLYSLYSDNVEFTNNVCFTRTNSACRIASGEHVLISNNEIYSGTITAADGGGSSTGPGIEINIDSGQPATDIEISKNYIHDLRGSGIWMTSESTRGDGVYIHNNIIRDVGNYPSDNKYSTAGITISQFNATLIENNVFDDTGIAGVRYAKRASDGVVDEEFTTIVRNNAFINIKDKITISAEPVMNSYSENHKFYVYYNDFYNNYDAFDGNLCIAWNNFALNPMFSDSMYHLQDDSPLIGMGYNGADIGAYGIGSGEIGTIGTIDHDEITDSGASDEPITEPTDDVNEDLNNCTSDDSNHDLDNTTIDDGNNSDEDETNHDLDNGTADYVDNSTTEYVDNSTTEYIDNSTSEHHRSSHSQGKGYAYIATPHEEILVCSAELTKPTFRRLVP